MRDRTYWPKLCLVQVGGEEEAAAIDPLAPGIDLAPCSTSWPTPPCSRCMHAARQDLEIFYRLGRMPLPLFDTQVAAMVCGFGEEVAYDTLVSRLAKAQLDKSSRFTDWARRPLTPAQITYALGDVTHLRTVYRALVEPRSSAAAAPPGSRRSWPASPTPPSSSRRPRRPGSGSRSAPATASSWPSSRSWPPGASRRRGAATCRAPASSATTS